MKKLSDPIEKLCIESGIYKYLYVQEIHDKFAALCASYHVTPENLVVSESVKQWGILLFGFSEKLYTIKDVLKNIRGGHEEKITLKNKLIILNSKEYRILTQHFINILSFFVCWPCHIITWEKMRQILGVSKSYDIQGHFYNIIINDIAAYQENVDKEKESFYLKRLIADYLLIRDFKNAEYYSDVLISKELDKDDTIKKLMDNVESVLRALQKQADNNSSNYIIWNWIDSLKHKDLPNMPYVCRMLNNGISFEYLYNGPYTTSTMKIIMSGGKNYINDGLFRLTKEDLMEGEFVYTLKNKGYRFVYLGNKYISQWGSDIDIPKQCFGYTPSTVFQYELLKQMSIADSPTLFLVHNLSETHMPFCNPIEMAVDLGFKSINEHEFRVNVNKNKSIPYDYLEQINASQRYLDEQIEYYHKYYPQNVKYEVFFSDHGFASYSDKIVSEEFAHIIMGITGENIVPRKVTKMYAVKAFPQIIYNLIDGRINDIGTEYNDEYTLLQYEDRYGVQPRDIELIKQFGATVHNMLFFFQYRGVITKEDCYVKWACGYEYYERDGNSENLIDNPQYKDRIEYLKHMAGDLYINTFKEDAYKDVRELYKLLGLEHFKEIKYV